MRGLLVCVVGPDASGKTTGINDFIKHNENWEVVKFPNRNTVIGAKIDKILKSQLTVSKEVELKLFADNRAEFRNEIYQKLINGTNIILDRYAYCGMAYTMSQQYQAAIAGDIKMFSKMFTINKLANLDKGNYKPDLVIICTDDFMDKRKTLEKYDLLDRNVLINNYIQACLYTNSPFCIKKKSIQYYVSKFCNPNDKLSRFL